MSGYILAIDQGTTSSRAIVFDGASRSPASGKMEFTQHFPGVGLGRARSRGNLGDASSATCKTALTRPGRTADDIAAIGITNQRETTIIWDRQTGKAIHNAIVWQDRRTAPICAEAEEAGQEKMVTRKTGLLLDPYFSGTKIKWLLDKVKGARGNGRKGRAGSRHGRQLPDLAADRRQGARDGRDQRLAHAALQYREERVGRRAAEAARRAGGHAARGQGLRRRFRRDRKELFGAAIPIRGVAGDQQAATIGQACFKPGMLKSTYGTGCFALLNTGSRHGAVEEPAADHDRLPARRQDHLCARRLDLHRRRGGAVAARRAEASSARPSTAARWRPRPTTRRTSIWSRPSSGWARRSGMPRRAARSTG